MDRIILIGVDQGVMIGGRFDGWLAQLTNAGWITIRKLEEADPYEALPDVLRSGQELAFGAVGPATGLRHDQTDHDAEARRRNLMSNFPVVDAEGLFSALTPSAIASATEEAAQYRAQLEFIDAALASRPDLTGTRSERINALIASAGGGEVVAGDIAKFDLWTARAQITLALRTLRVVEHYLPAIMDYHAPSSGLTGRQAVERVENTIVALATPPAPAATGAYAFTGDDVTFLNGEHWSAGFEAGRAIGYEAGKTAATGAGLVEADIIGLRARCEGRRKLGISDGESEGDGEEMATLTVPLLMLERVLAALAAPDAPAAVAVEAINSLGASVYSLLKMTFVRDPDAKVTVAGTCGVALLAYIARLESGSVAKDALAAPAGRGSKADG